MVRKVLLSLSLLAFAGAANAGLFGPDKFKVVQADTRFSESPNPTFTGQNNRISKKSIAGGRHIDADGVFVEPSVTKNRQTGQVIALAFFIVNKTSIDTTYGDVNSLGTPQKIAFLLGGNKSIVLPITNGDAATSGAINYNTVSRSASSAVTESGIAAITPEQYLEIISAGTVAAQITGSKRAVTYEVKEIDPNFIANLKTFYEGYIKTQPAK